MTPEEKKEAQYQFLAEFAIDPDDEEDVEVVLERFRQVRKEIAEERRQRLIDEGTIIPAQGERGPLPPLIDIGPHDDLFARDEEA